MSIRAFTTVSLNWRPTAFRSVRRSKATAVSTITGWDEYDRRVLGEKAPRETFAGRETRWMRTNMPRPGIQDDQPKNRVKDMDDERTDVHFLIPTSWLCVVGLGSPRPMSVNKMTNIPCHSTKLSHYRRVGECIRRVEVSACPTEY